MAPTVTIIHQGPDSYIADVDFHAGETEATLSHNLGAIPLELYLTGTTESTGKLYIDDVTENDLKVKVGTTTFDTPGARIEVRRPHTIGK